MQLRIPRPRKADYRLSALEKRTLLAASVTGSLYNDANSNGAKDASETGLSGWTVFLDANFNNRLDSGEVTTSTDSSGNYTFTNVAAGTAHVAIVTQANYEETSPSPGRLIVTQKVNNFGQTTYPTAEEIDPVTGLFLRNKNIDQISFSTSAGGCVGPGVYYNVAPVSSSTSQITVYDLNSGLALQGKTFSISTPVGVNGAAYVNGKVYLSTTTTGSGQILVWDPSTQQLTSSFGVNGLHLTGGFTGSADDGYLYATDLNGTRSVIDVIDPVAKTLVRQVTSQVNITNGLAYVDGELLAGTFSNGNQIYRIDPQTGALVGTIILANDGIHMGNITALSCDGSAQRTVTVPASGSIAAGTFGVSAISATPTGIALISTGTYRVYGTVAGASVLLANSANTTVLTKTATGTSTDFTITPASGAMLIAGQTEPNKIESDLSEVYYTNTTFAVATDLADASDSGTSSHDNVTSVTTPTFVGAADNGATVKIYANGIQIGSGVAASGAYSITTSQVFSPSNTIYASINSTSTSGSSGLQMSVVTTGPSLFTTGSSVDAPYVAFDFTQGTWLATTGDAVTVKNLSTNVSTALPWQNVLYNPSSNEVDFILAGNGLSLPDGNYVATLSHTKLSDIAGNQLSSDRSALFYMLHGDGNNDRIVNTLDFNALATNYSKVVSGASKGDFNFDGTVTSTDFDLLAANFGKKLATSGDIPEAAIATMSKPVTSLFNSDPEIKTDDVTSVLA